jgi:hypothetical protein
VAVGKRKPDRRYEDIRNPELLAGIEIARQEAAEGKAKRFSTLEELLADLHRSVGD